MTVETAAAEVWVAGYKIIDVTTGEVYNEPYGGEKDLLTIEEASDLRAKIINRSQEDKHFSADLYQMVAIINTDPDYQKYLEKGDAPTNSGKPTLGGSTPIL